MAQFLALYCRLWTSAEANSSIAGYPDAVVTASIPFDIMAKLNLGSMGSPAMRKDNQWQSLLLL